MRRRQEKRAKIEENRRLRQLPDNGQQLETFTVGFPYSIFGKTAEVLSSHLLFSRKAVIVISP